MQQRNIGYLSLTALLVVVFLWHAWADAMRGDFLTACGDLTMAVLCVMLFDAEYTNPTSIL
jgi:hypothetical protein